MPYDSLAGPPAHAVIETNASAICPRFRVPYATSRGSPPPGGAPLSSSHLLPC